MDLADLSATFEDHVLQNEELEDRLSDDLRSRDQHLLRLKDEVLDVKDFGDCVALTELTLDDFRPELLKYIEANKADPESFTWLVIINYLPVSLWPLQGATETRRRRMRHRLSGRTEPTGASSRCVEGHQTGHVYPKCDCSI